MVSKLRAFNFCPVMAASSFCEKLGLQRSSRKRLLGRRKGSALALAAFSDSVRGTGGDPSPRAAELSAAAFRTCSVWLLPSREPGVEPGGSVRDPEVLKEVAGAPWPGEPAPHLFPPCVLGMLPKGRWRWLRFKFSGPF